MLSARLRNETGECHRRLEDRLDLFNRVDSIDGYQEILKRFYGFYQTVESSLLRHRDALHVREFHIEDRLKSSALRSDLESLGISPAMVDPAPDSAVPSIHDLPSVLGCLYVLEGSTLGGQVITRHFQETLGQPFLDASRFYSSYGSETAARWREFKNFMDDIAAQADPELSDAAVATANETFQKIESWLCQ